jgi:hypothetical protein
MVIPCFFAHVFFNHPDMSLTLCDFIGMLLITITMFCIVVVSMYSADYTIFISCRYQDMASRTNKRGIAAKKAQIQKQAGRFKGMQRFTYPKRKLSLEEAKQNGVVGAETNPKGNTYNWFLKGRKICRETRLRVDPDGWRYVRTPSGGSDFVEIPISGWLRKKLMKNTTRGY